MAIPTAQHRPDCGGWSSPPRSPPTPRSLPRSRSATSSASGSTPGRLYLVGVTPDLHSEPPTPAARILGCDALQFFEPAHQNVRARFAPNRPNRGGELWSRSTDWLATNGELPAPTE